jgi:dCMP deaminase
MGEIVSQRPRGVKRKAEVHRTPGGPAVIVRDSPVLLHRRSMAEETRRRPSWHEYFMTITREVAGRSTCMRAAVGAVIVRDRSILATGYNGAPAGMPHCLDVGCLVYESRTPSGDLEQNCFRTIHAEINAIAQAARNGTSIQGADIYVTHTPCIHCFKTLVNSGIKRVFYAREYKLHTLEELRRYTGVELVPVPAPDSNDEA